jgi:serine/threonine-protein kinase RsbW
MAAGTTVRLVFPSEVRLIDLVHTTAESVAGLAGFDEDEALNLALAVREAVINAICHGHGEDPRRKVRVTLAAGQRGLRVSVSDRGAGFDADSMPDPTVGDNRLRASGRGLLLMRAFVDQVRFRRRPGGGTEVTLIKRLPPGEAQPDSRRARR